MRPRWCHPLCAQHRGRAGAIRRAPPGRAGAIRSEQRTELALSAVRITGPRWSCPTRAAGAEVELSDAPELELSDALSTGVELVPSAVRSAPGPSWCHSPRAQHRSRASAIRLELSDARATGVERVLSAARHWDRAGAVRRSHHRAEMALSDARATGAEMEPSEAPELELSATQHRAELGAWTRTHGAELGRWIRATRPNWSYPPRTGPQSPGSAEDRTPVVPVVAPVVAPVMVPRWRRWKSRRSPERTPPTLHGAQPCHGTARPPSAPSARPLLARLYA
ncbi:hypothetical protein [Stigmatella hybrida]|uniref:hypothetical protein n=1 Tax=Stigmatella hybrida TaxID=394097 RepID=UPI001CDB0FA7|nr:hypothetical protein [Stigmatella hybrida]